MSVSSRIGISLTAGFRLLEAMAPAGTRPRRALVLGGGMALGVFEAGAYAALEETDSPPGH